jgi:hypothetical protein
MYKKSEGSIDWLQTKIQDRRKQSAHPRDRKRSFQTFQGKKEARVKIQHEKDGRRYIKPFIPI